MNYWLLALILKAQEAIEFVALGGLFAKVRTAAPKTVAKQSTL
nr:hypothetical protein [uncultured Rhodoferax sp.]